MTTAAQRRINARIGALSLHAKIDDPAAHTAPARRAFHDKFEKQVDPDGVLDPEVRARKAAFARQAYFAQLAKASADARRARKSALSGPTKRGGSS
jgi:hypothetical protein